MVHKRKKTLIQVWFLLMQISLFFKKFSQIIIFYPVSEIMSLKLSFYLFCFSVLTCFISELFAPSVESLAVEQCIQLQSFTQSKCMH